MDIQTINISLQKKVSEYCLTSCPAKCCHIGKLLISKELVTAYNLLAKERSDGYFEFLIENGCFFLRNNLCSIHKNPLKPKICSEYPFFIRGKTLFIASSCKAVQEGIFEEDLKDLTKKEIHYLLQ